MEDFQKILPYLKDVESVVLEGWGESLLHPQLVPIVRLAKKEGPQVGFVTSVMGLNPNSIEGLVDAGLDFMGFSLAGATPQTHNSIRVHSDLNQLLQEIRSLQSLKARRRSEVPRLHIVYLLLKDNISETPKILDLAHDLEIREVILIHLAQVSNRWQDDQKCFSRQGFPEYEKILQEAEGKARKLKISLRCPPLSAQEVPLCSENPLRNLYISVSGNVSPCVYLNPPVDSPFLRIYDGRDFRIEKVKFGNIFGEPFEKIWHREAYVDFRDCFQKRKKRFDDLYESLLNPDRFGSLDKRPLPPPPLPCQSCHKMWGV